MNNAAIKNVLTQFSLFNKLDDVQIGVLTKYSVVLNTNQGDYVFNRGDSSKGLYILLKGQLKLGVTSSQGVEKVVNIIAPYDSFGETGLFLKHQMPSYAKAITKSKVLLVPEYIMHSLMDTNANVARLMQEKLSVSLHQMIQDIETLTLPTATQRLVDYLLKISTKTGNVEYIILPVRKETIASILNTSPETLSRSINKLSNIGLIKVKGKHVTITDILKLRTFTVDN